MYTRRTSHQKPAVMAEKEMIKIRVIFRMEVQSQHQMIAAVNAASANLLAHIGGKCPHVDACAPMNNIPDLFVFMSISEDLLTDDKGRCLYNELDSAVCRFVQVFKAHFPRLIVRAFDFTRKQRQVAFHPITE